MFGYNSLIYDSPFVELLTITDSSKPSYTTVIQSVLSCKWSMWLGHFYTIPSKFNLEE